MLSVHGLRAAVSDIGAEHGLAVAVAVAIFVVVVEMVLVAVRVTVVAKRH